MKRLSALLLSALLATGCVPSPKPTGSAPETTTSTAGSSFETAIMINEQNTVEGVAAEYEWIRANRPGWKVETQMLVEVGNRPFDVLIITKGGKTEEVYFDISNFFGKI